jgi:hypothetical protein
VRAHPLALKELKMAMATLDHVVVNAKFDMDAVAACFEELGFALTERGHHSLGSVNHLMMFHDHYLELVGLPLNTTTLRREVLDSTLGIDALVLKTDDAPATYARLRDLAFRVGEPQSFTRAVAIDGNEEIAQFRTTRLAPGEMPAGRVYFCEHVTPQWVFRPEWTVHPNGAQALVELVIVSADPAAEAARYAQLTGGAINRFELVFNSKAEYQARYGALTSGGGARDAFFGAVVVEVRDLAALRERLAKLAGPALEAAGMAVTEAVYPRTGALSVVVSLTQVDTTIEFVSPAASGLARATMSTGTMRSSKDGVDSSPPLSR